MNQKLQPKRGPSALCVFAREPQPGRVKTRLAAVLGAEAAALVARASLLDTLERLRPFPGDLWVAHTPADATDGFRELLDEIGSRAFLMPQKGRDLGKRLDCAIQRLRARGYERVLLLGADSPTLPWSALLALHDALTTHPFALGPAYDGGFWGLAAREWRAGLLDELPWSCPETFAATQARLSTLGPVALAPPWYDLDEPEDLRRLRDDPALAFCPRLNRLLSSRLVALFL